MNELLVLSINVRNYRYFSLQSDCNQFDVQGSHDGENWFSLSESDDLHKAQIIRFEGGIDGQIDFVYLRIPKVLGNVEQPKGKIEFYATMPGNVLSEVMFE